MTPQRSSKNEGGVPAADRTRAGCPNLDIPYTEAFPALELSVSRHAIVARTGGYGMSK